MKAELRVIGLLLSVTMIAEGEMLTWTFEKSGRTMEGEIVGFAGDVVNLKQPDGKTYSVPIAYLTASNRVYLAAERARQWKEVEVVKLEGATSAGRYKRCTVRGEDVNGGILIDLLPSSVEAILNNRNQQAADIADLAAAIEHRTRVVRRADAVTPVAAAGRGGYVNWVMSRRARINLAFEDIEDAKIQLQKLQVAYAEYLEKTKAATIVKMKKTALVYEGLSVWECFDSRKQHQ